MIVFNFGEIGRLGNYFFGFLRRDPLVNRTLWLNECLLLNLVVGTLSAGSGYALGRLVPYWLALVRAEIPWTKIAGFSYRKLRGKEACMPNVDIG